MGAKPTLAWACALQEYHKQPTPCRRDKPPISTAAVMERAGWPTSFGGGLAIRTQTAAQTCAGSQAHARVSMPCQARQRSIRRLSHAPVPPMSITTVKERTRTEPHDHTQDSVPTRCPADRTRIARKAPGHAAGAAVRCERPLQSPAAQETETQASTAAA